MSPLAISSIVFACIFGVALVAMFLKGFLPEHHLSADSKDVVKLGMGTMATLAAIVLGLLIATAKGTYDARAAPFRNTLPRSCCSTASWPNTARKRRRPASFRAPPSRPPWTVSGPARALKRRTSRPGGPGGGGSHVRQDRGPRAQNDAQREDGALETTVDLAQERLRLFARQDGSLPLPFLIVLAAWLVILFAGYGLVAPRNTTVVAVLFFFALGGRGDLSASGLSTPFAGMMRISSGPLRDALSVLGK